MIVLEGRLERVSRAECEEGTTPIRARRMPQPTQCLACHVCVDFQRYPWVTVPKFLPNATDVL